MRSTVLIQLSGEGQFKPTEIKQEVEVGKKNVKGTGWVRPDGTL